MSSRLAGLIPESLETHISLKDAARALDVNPRTILRWSEIGKFPPLLRIGGPIRPRIRIRLEDVKAFLAEKGGKS
jgi:predicted site-specific integrase-resolvase